MAIGTVLINGTKYEIGGGAIKKYQHNITANGQNGTVICNFQIVNTSPSTLNAEAIKKYLKDIGCNATSKYYPATGVFNTTASSSPGVVYGISIALQYYGPNGDELYPMTNPSSGPMTMTITDDVVQI